MAQPLRIKSAGAVYHVMAGGNRGWDTYTRVSQAVSRLQ